MATTTTTWVSGTTGNWFTPANWSAGVPQADDTATIGSGLAIIAPGAPAIEGVAIVLGGQDTGEPVTLRATNATFAPDVPSSGPSLNTSITVTGGDPSTSPLRARFLTKGETSFDGQIIVEAMGGGLVIDAVADQGTAGNFTFNNSDQKAVMVVTQESTLTFRGQTITNDGLIQVEGGAHIAESVDFTGEGFFVLENGGNLKLEGTLGRSQEVNFADGTGSVTITSTGEFGGVFGFTEFGGSRINLEGIVADQAQYLEAGDDLPGTFVLLDDGNVVASLDMQQIDPDTLDPLGGEGLEAADFTLSSNGHGGTLVTYTPQSTLFPEQALPVPVVAATGTLVALSDLLTNAFGTDAPGWFKIRLLETGPFTNQSNDIGYWSKPDTTPVWYFNDQPIDGPIDIDVDAISRVQLKVGNQINGPALFRAQVTQKSEGPTAEWITYNVWSVDPKIQDFMEDRGFTGLPTPTAVAASAHAYDKTFGNLLNTNLCNWIADNVAAGAGAPMPPANFALDPSLNQPGGFWRIAYTGIGPSPQKDWSSLVKRGDIVRMGWFKPETGVASGHTTTVLGAAFEVNGETKIKVYDNIDDNPPHLPAGEYIGIHDASYWVATDPADITIYRLDPNQQYLILGSNLGEVIQGTVFNDLFQPGGGADVITGGPGVNEVEGTVDELDGITVTDFAVGDSLDFTDLGPGTASVAYSDADGALQVMSNGTPVASITMPEPGPRGSFFLWDDGSGGTIASLLGTATIRDAHPTGYPIDPTVFSLRIAATASVGGSGITATDIHPSFVANLGTVDATGIGITLEDGGGIQNGNKADATPSISGSTGIVFRGEGTVTNFGTIAGTAGWAIKFDSAEGHLVLHGTSVLDGKVRGAGGDLRLGNKAGPGTVEGLGSEIVGFDTITVDAGSSWDLAGPSSLAADVTMTIAGAVELLERLVNRGTIELAGNVGFTGPAASTFVNSGLVAKSAGDGTSAVGVAVRNDGTLEAAVGTLDLQGAITGSGVLEIDAGAVLEVDAAVSAGQTVAFGIGINTLVLNDAESFAATLSGFAKGDRLDLTEFDLATTTVAFQDGTLTVTDGALQAHIALIGQYTASFFQATSDGHGGTNVTYAPPPSEAGTLLAAPHA